MIFLIYYSNSISCHPQLSSVCFTDAACFLRQVVSHCEWLDMAEEKLPHTGHPFLYSNFLMRDGELEKNTKF